MFLRLVFFFQINYLCTFKIFLVNLVVLKMKWRVFRFKYVSVYHQVSISSLQIVTIIPTTFKGPYVELIMVNCVDKISLELAKVL